VIRRFDTENGFGAWVVEILGARNLRELGGYRMADGRRVKQGIIYRGGHPGGITLADLPQLHALGLSAIVDLRTSEERSDLPFPESLTSRLQYWTRDYELSRSDIVRILRDPVTNAATMRLHLIESYRQLANEQHDGLAAALRLLLEGKAPVLINCTAGKDRTGVVCAILLAALGADHELIRQDYALTERLHDPSGQLFHIDPDGPFAYLLEVDPEVWRTMMRSDPAYIDATFAAIEERHGDIGGYLASAHGLDPTQIDRLRSLVLED